MPSCGINCMIFDEPFGDIPPRPVLVRSVHRICEGNCGRSVSDYNHRFCYSCALPNSQEFLYHHRHCYIRAPNAPRAPISKL